MCILQTVVWIELNMEEHFKDPSLEGRNSRDTLCKLLHIWHYTVMNTKYWHAACCSYNENVIKIYKTGNFLHEKIKYSWVASNAFQNKNKKILEL
jgi:hypothetical protein